MAIATISGFIAQRPFDVTVLLVYLAILHRRAKAEMKHE